MVTMQLERHDPAYRCLFPDWSGPRPLSYFLTENLLEARRASFFPTNGAGPDEDVNIYLAHALAGFLRAAVDPRVESPGSPLLRCESKSLPRAWRAERYRRNADHRLLCQGLMDRGDALRRRSVPHGMTRAETRTRDRSIGAACYGMAAALLEDRGAGWGGLAEVLRKLERHYEDYVHVLAVLATRRLGLGARLGEQDLRSLWQRPPQPFESDPERREPSPPSAGHVPGGSMDELLDLLALTQVC